MAEQSRGSVDRLRYVWRRRSDAPRPVDDRGHHSGAPLFTPAGPGRKSLHNFSVDGRMDVCCIATGPSQERYALGNLFTQSFQEVWNGPSAREFRRTVNSANPLPPCQRCPMAYGYQGLFFDRAYTLGRIQARVHKVLLRNLRRVHMPFTWRITNTVTQATCSMVSALFFRGFRRT